MSDNFNKVQSDDIDNFAFDDDEAFGQIQKMKVQTGDSSFQNNTLKLVPRNQTMKDDLTSMPDAGFHGISQGQIE